VTNNGRFVLRDFTQVVGRVLGQRIDHPELVGHRFQREAVQDPRRRCVVASPSGDSANGSSGTVLPLAS